MNAKAKTTAPKERAAAPKREAFVSFEEAVGRLSREFINSSTGEPRTWGAMWGCDRAYAICEECYRQKPDETIAMLDALLGQGVTWRRGLEIARKLGVNLDAVPRNI